jgi:anti-sigma B factor antagonist
MKIDIRHEAGVAFINPRGKLTIAGGDAALRDRIEEAVAAGATKIVVGLGDVTAMDSSGLGELVAAKKRCAEQGAEIKLLDVNQRINRVLTMTRLVGLFDIFSDEKSALDSFD